MNKFQIPKQNLLISSIFGGLGFIGFIPLSSIKYSPYFGLLLFAVMLIYLTMGEIKNE